jgi:integrase
MDDKITWDSKLTGFGLRERNGRKTWIVQYRLGHKQRRMKVGSAEKLTEAKAREAARKTLARVELGEDPAADKAQTRKEAKHTLRSVATDYLAAKKPQLRARTYRELVRYLGVDPDAGPEEARRRKRDLTGYWSTLHSVPVNVITRRDVAAELGRITRKNGATAAVRARSTLSAFYVWCLGEGLCDANPTIGTNKPAESKPRDRVLDGAIKDDGDRAKLYELPELRAVWRAAGDDAHGRIVKLLIMCGARREEVGGLRWTEINSVAHMICLPADRCKNGHTHDIPLSEFAWALLPERTGEFVFGGHRGFTAWSRAKADLDKRLGESVAAWRVHDIRRTVATRLGDLGVLPHVIEAALNHQGGTKRGVAGTYNKSSYDRECRAALMMWSDHVRSVVEGAEHRVVPFQQRTVTS